MLLFITCGCNTKKHVSNLKIYALVKEVKIFLENHCIFTGLNWII